MLTHVYMYIHTSTHIYTHAHTILMQTGRTALAWAALKGHKNVVDILLNAKADPDIQDKVKLTLCVYVCVCVCVCVFVCICVIVCVQYYMCTHVRSWCVPVCGSLHNIDWGVWNAWSRVPQLMSCNWFVGSWPPFIIGLLMMTHPLPVAGKLPIKPLVARKPPTNVYGCVLMCILLVLYCGVCASTLMTWL